MKNKILSAILFGLLLITSLTGCVSTPPIESKGEAKGTVSAGATSVTETSDIKNAESVPQTDEQEAATQSDPAETQQPAEKIKSEMPTQQSEKLVMQESQKTAEQPKPIKESEATAPVRTEPFIQTEPETEPTKLSEPTETESQQPAESAFNIAYWVSYAKNYAVGIGLELDSEAVSCWDNPIRAHARCTYLERDIQDRLNFYVQSGDITCVWIWAEPLGNEQYDIFIGYA
ncbi:MAG: hypothetical protein HFE77_05350 [Clostridiales bacterium]|nr:hypothetical protein [Clostridiales bacterium]